jgi:hypothetical protein
MLLRCRNHGPPRGKSDDYVAFLEPVGHSNNAAVYCDRDGCSSPAVMYLTEKEYEENQLSGKRIFSLRQGGCSIKGQSGGATQLPGVNISIDQTTLP